MILAVAPYGRKNMILYEKNFELTENNTFDHVFCY